MRVCVCVHSPRGVPDSPEDAAVAKDDDGEGDEEDEGEEQHGVGAHGGREGHVVPGARGHQSLGHVGACSRGKPVVTR